MVRNNLAKKSQSSHNQVEQEIHPGLTKTINGVVKNNTRRHFKTISFFSGCGGLDLGFIGNFIYKGRRFKRNPYNILNAYDFDEKCVATYKMNVADHVEVQDLSNYDSHVFPPAEVLIGGFPCQEFATCGPRQGLGSERGRLYQALNEYMKVHKPLLVVGENVPGLANIQGGRMLKSMIKDLEATGYRFEVWTLYAPDYGIPQRRKRLFIIGVRKDLRGFPKCPPPTHIGEHRSIEWAIDDLREIEDESVINQSQYFRAAKAKKGNGQGDEISKASQPSYTIRANAKSRVQFHYSLPRRLTVRECARLQTFPDNFVFPHSATTNIKQIGNAVPPVLGHAVAKEIAKYLRRL